MEGIKFMKPQSNIQLFNLRNLEYCFDTFNVYYVDDNKDLVVFNIGEDVDNFKMDMKTYDNLETWWVSCVPNAPDKTVNLHTFKLKPKRVQGLMLDDIVAIKKIEYRVAKELFRGMSFPNWGANVISV